MAKKKKNIPFHIVHNYKHYELNNGIIKFWTRDENSAKLYCEKIKWSPLSLKEVENSNETVSTEL